MEYPSAYTGCAKETSLTLKTEKNRRMISCTCSRLPSSVFLHLFQDDHRYRNMPFMLPAHCFLQFLAAAQRFSAFPEWKQTHIFHGSCSHRFQGWDKEGRHRSDGHPPRIAMDLGSKPICFMDVFTSSMIRISFSIMVRIFA